MPTPALPAPSFSIAGLQLGRPAPLFLIAGPCVIESESHALALAAELSRQARVAGIPYIFKASYDKANRSSPRGFRGPGLETGLRALARIKAELGLPILTDIHQPHEAQPVAEVADILQIPAFLCRQTDLLAAAARTGRPVNLKKGQFLAPWDMRGALEKILAEGNDRVILTERGSSFGYNNLVVDFRSFALLRDLGAPVVFDVTHSLQLPGAAGDHSGGQPQFIEMLARAGVAAGVDGLFLEVHEQPERALSDGANALPLARFSGLLQEIQKLQTALRPELATTNIKL